MSLHEVLSGIKWPGNLADEKMELNVKKNQNTLKHKNHEYMQTQETSLRINVLRF